MTEEPSDRDLAGRVVSNGDEDAFRALYRRHSAGLYRFVLRLSGGDTSEANDLAQETWLRAARGLGRFRWESAFRTWLCGIAFNQYRELSRAKGRSITEVEEPVDVAGHVPDPGRRIDLERALQLLQPGFRAVLVLHDVEGFTHKEIGEHLGISDGTCKSRLHEARKTVRRLLGAGPETAR